MPAINRDFPNFRPTVPHHYYNLQHPGELRTINRRARKNLLMQRRIISRLDRGMKLSRRQKRSNPAL